MDESDASDKRKKPGQVTATNFDSAIRGSTEQQVPNGAHAPDRTLWASEGMGVVSDVNHAHSYCQYTLCPTKVP